VAEATFKPFQQTVLGQNLLQELLLLFTFGEQAVLGGVLMPLSVRPAVVVVVHMYLVMHHFQRLIQLKL
jgi:hypothetical protein